ncbi:hypothetical protein GN956_G26832 [Arapaima gigas]
MKVYKHIHVNTVHVLDVRRDLKRRSDTDCSVVLIVLHSIPGDADVLVTVSVFGSAASLPNLCLQTREVSGSRSS